MEINLIDIKKALIIQFDNEAKSNDGTSCYHANALIERPMGLLKDDYFLDIDTLTLYPIAYLGDDKFLKESPILGIQYAYSIESYFPESLTEKEKILQKASYANTWYESTKKLEVDNKIICFQKRKYERLKRRFIL